MLVIFPFEELYYKNLGVNATYVGHPFLDNWEPQKLEKSKLKLGFKTNQKLIGIFPGSRIEEINHHLPIYIESYKMLSKKFPQVKFALGLPPGINADYIQNNFEIGKIEIIENQSITLLGCVDAAMVTSGTISLQAAFMLTPCVVGYKLSNISWYISKRLVKINFIAMANIIANKIIFKELLQNNLNPTNIYKEIEKIIINKEYVSEMKKELNTMKEKFLTKTHAIDNAAEIIYNQINAKN